MNINHNDIYLQKTNFESAALIIKQQVLWFPTPHPTTEHNEVRHSMVLLYRSIYGILRLTDRGGGHPEPEILESGQ